MNNIYLYYGTEDFLIGEELKTFKKENFEELDEPLQDQVIQSIVTPSLWGEKTVIIKNFDFEDDTQIIAAIKNKPKEIRAVFVVYGEIDRRKKIFKELEKTATCCEFKSYADWQQDKIASFIVQRAGTLGKKIDLEDAMLLAEICGNNLRMLVSEIEKLAVFVGNSKSITKEDIEELSCVGSVAAFSLVNYLRQRNISKSLEVLDKLLKDREEPVRLLQLITTQYRLMLKVKDIGLSNVALLNTNIFFAKKAFEASKKYNMEELKKIIRLLSDADFKLKNTSQSPRNILELLLMDIC